MKNIDKLINGKNELGRIVSVEPMDSSTEIFTEEPDGTVKSQIVPNEYWILSNKCPDPEFQMMDGKLHYKFIKTYTDRQMFEQDRRDFRRGYDIFTVWNPKEAFLTREGYTYFKGMKHDEVSCLAFDIETTGLKHDKTSRVLIISNTLRKKGKIIRKMFTHDQFKNQGELIRAWCNWVREVNPTILLGHNILMYDIPYMRYVAQQFGVNLNLGRDDSDIEISDYEVEFRKDANTFYKYRKMHIYGREIIDTLFLSYKYDTGRKYENYGLKNIIKQEGLEVQNRQFYDASQIRHNYQKPLEWAKIKKYAEFDADDALNLYILMSPSFFYMTQSVARSFQHVIESASGGQINTIMNRAYIQDNHSVPMATESAKFEGAISDGFPGIYSNCVKWDVASLYPSIIMEYEIYDKEKDPKAYFLQLVKIFTEKRLEYKALAKTDKYYDDLQNSYKIFINSCYGFLGSKHSNFNYPFGAAEVTRNGREILDKAIVWATGRNYEHWKKLKTLEL